MSPPEPAPEGDVIGALLSRVREALDADRAEPGVPLAQALLTAGVALAAHHIDDGTPCRPFLPDVEVTPTEVALVVCAMLEAADIDMPQLNMWQALGIGYVPEPHPGTRGTP